MAEKRAYLLKSGDRVIVKGTIHTVKRVDAGPHKDSYTVRLKGHPPINADFGTIVEVIGE